MAEHDTSSTEVSPMVGTQNNSQSFSPLPETQETKQTVTPEDFRLRVKSFDSVAGSIWNIPCGIASKVVRNKTIAILGDTDEAETEADKLGEMVRLSDESLKAAKDATARILARRCKDGEGADTAILVGVMAELGFNFRSVMKELSRIEAKAIKVHAKEKK